MSPSGPTSPARRPTWRGNGGMSPHTPQRKRASLTKGTSAPDVGYCTIETSGHREKLPRPRTGIDAEAVYGRINEDAPQSPREPCTPSASPKSPAVSIAREKNAARQFMWATQEAVMIRPAEIASKLPLPLAVVLAPFADSADCTSLPISDSGDEEPLRCPRCRCYVNAHYKWSYGKSAKLQCNMCSHVMDVPDEFVADMERNGQTADEETHPELIFGSVDFKSAIYHDDDVPDGPPVPAVCFLIDTSLAAVSNGFTSTVLESLEQTLEASDLGIERPIFIVTFDEILTFYEPMRSGRFRLVTMADMEEPFVPVSTSFLCLDMADKDRKLMLLNLLSSLREEFTSNDSCSPHSTMTASTRGSTLSPASVFFPGEDVSRSPSSSSTSSIALSSTVEALASVGGGDVILFQWSTSDGFGVEKGTPNQKVDFAEEIRLACLKASVALTCVTASTSNDLPTDSRLQTMCWRTGGESSHLVSFSPALQPVLTCNLTHFLKKMQASAYNCVVKLRCSKGLSCKSLVAAWPAASSSTDQSAFEVPRLTPDSSVAFTLCPEFDFSDEEDWAKRSKQILYIQAAILYTNTKGERLVRTHTIAVNTVTSVRSAFQSVNLPPLMTVLMKQAALMALEPSPNAKQLPRDFLLEFCLQVLSSYRKRCFEYTPNSSMLVTPKQLVLLPLYVLSGRKLLYSMIGGKEDKVVSEEGLQRLLRMPVHSMMAALYPRVYPLPAPAHEGCDLPRSSPALEEHVARGSSPAYLITNGFGIWYHTVDAGDTSSVEKLRTNAMQLSERIREDLEPSPAWIPLTELTRLPSTVAAAEAAEKAKQLSNEALSPMKYGSRTPGSRTPGTRKMSGPLVSDSFSWEEKVLLSTLFVEDAGVTEMSYEQWVTFLQTQVEGRMKDARSIDGDLYFGG
jgi:protein transport protein SEC24